MLRNTFQRQSLTRILLQQLWNQILGILRHTTRPANIHTRDPCIGGCVRIRLKWRTSNKKLVEQHAQGPGIHLFIVFTSLYHLRWEVVQSTAESVTARSGCMYTPSKICNFDGIASTEQQVLRFDIYSLTTGIRTWEWYCWCIAIC